MSARSPALVADVGGTFLRIALVDGDGALDHHRRLPTPTARLEDALRDYLAEHGVAPRAAFLGAAGRVRRAGAGARVALTNNPLVVDAQALATALGCEVRLHNDVAAVAAALPVLAPDRLEVWSEEAPRPDAPRLVVSLGTGFGAALLSAAGEVIATEAGHAPLPKDALVHPALATRFDSIESLLSGPGWRRLSEAEPDAGIALAMFTFALARVIAALALTTGAWGGVHLAGGLFDALAPAIDVRALRGALVPPEDDGLDLDRLPLAAIRDPHAALRGLARLAGPAAE